MKTSVVGFPRIGSLRELKFASEKYFRNEISESELLKTAKEIRISNLKKQKEENIDYIPTNDFSFYDNMLDAAVMLGVIPERFKINGLSALDTYFAMARGYQGDKGDVKALAMKKWFDTNYHYMVPEIDDETVIKFSDEKAVNEANEAVSEGISPKTVTVGAYTFLKLARYTGEKNAFDFAESAACAYIELIKKTPSEVVELDEPCLVTDMTDDDKKLFDIIYKKILSEKSGKKISLQTYFGDVRDYYDEICSMDFDFIGLDFIHGKETLNLVRKGFPKDKTLIAGVVNGKNIHKNNYEKTIALLKEIGKYAENVVIGTSCSLLHVPYTVNNETKLSEKYLRHFAFAEEKLTELKDLGQIISDNEPEKNPLYIKNVELFKIKENVKNDEVQNRVNSLTDKDFVRLPEFNEREKIQKKEFNLPLFPTTTIGSFPQTKEVRENRSNFKKGLITEKEYDDFNKKKIADVVKLQEEIGLDVLVHGEFERNDMVEYFGECLDGFVFTEKAWVQSYGTRCVKPPIIWGDISRKKAMTVKWSTYAQSLTSKPMKGMLTGPVTILNWSFPREDITHCESVLQIALAIRDEVLDLEKNGIKVIQVDEAALREKLPLRKSDWKSDYLDWAIPAFRLVHSGVKPETQIHTHMCYSEFTDIIKEIDDMDADVITFEASRSDLTILDSLKENNFRTEVGPGVYDIHSPRIPSKEEIKTALNRMLAKIDKNKLWVNPDCGLKTRTDKEVIPSLENLVAAAKEIRNENS